MLELRDTALGADRVAEATVDHSGIILPAVGLGDHGLLARPVVERRRLVEVPDRGVDLGLGANRVGRESDAVGQGSEDFGGVATRDSEVAVDVVRDPVAPSVEALIGAVLVVGIGDLGRGLHGRLLGDWLGDRDGLLATGDEQDEGENEGCEKPHDELPGGGRGTVRKIVFTEPYFVSYFLGFCQL